MLNYLLAATLTTAAVLQGSRGETLRSVSALPAHVAGTFEEIAACHLTPQRDYIIFDRRSHAVSRVAGDATAAVKELVLIGIEPGRILLPIAFDSAPDGTFVVADAPGGVERIQIFLDSGSRMGGFSLPRRAAPRVTLGNMVLNGVGSVNYTGTSILLSDPESGALISEYGLDGSVVRTFGGLRATGHEQDRDLHLALNSGYSLSINGGGFYFVFVAGVPMFRKYNAAGEMLYERHIEGPEIDQHLRSLPSVWPKRKTASGEYPIVTTAIRTAAVDERGSLWISLLAPLTYVYDSSGEKERTIEFRGSGLLSPNHFFFTADGRLIVSPGCYAFNVKQRQ
ncbi:hypothetical protein BH18ACI5_BH18ACI5_00180 [soil metagenome]